MKEPEPLLILDARRPDGLTQRPYGILGAVPIIMREASTDIPDLPRNQEIVVYCSSDDGADSSQLLTWLAAVGYRRLWRLQGGFAAWRRANLPMVQVMFGTRNRRRLRLTPARKLSLIEGKLSEDSGRVPGFLSTAALPLQRDITVLCLGIVQTGLVPRPPEATLRSVQSLMRLVEHVGALYSAELRDFEGEETRLYFADMGSAIEAAFDLRALLCRERIASEETPLVRLALDTGRMTLGYACTQPTPIRCVIGSPVSNAARILKQAPPGGIVATERLIKLGRDRARALVERFARLPNRTHVRTGEPTISVFLSLPDQDDLTGISR